MRLTSNEPEIITELDQHLGKLRVKLQRVITKHDYLNNLMIDVQTGISHFNERLEVLQIETEETKVSEDHISIESLKKLGQKAKQVYQVIERNRHFNELCKSKMPLVNEEELLVCFEQNQRRENVSW